MAAGKHNILIQKGSTFYKQIVLRGADSVPVDLTGATVMGQVRETSDAVLAAQFDVTIPTPTNGTIILGLIPSITATIPFARGGYDIEIHYADGRVDRMLEGAVVVSNEFTKDPV